MDMIHNEQSNVAQSQECINDKAVTWFAVSFA